MKTVSEYAKANNLHRQWVGKMIKDGRLKAKKKELPGTRHGFIWLIPDNGKILSKSS